MSSTDSESIPMGLTQSTRVTYSIPATDPRHSAYYLLPAGHPPPPSKNWYWDGKDVGEREPPSYSKEKLVIGCELTCGGSYLIRRALATEILKKGSDKMKLET